MLDSLLTLEAVFPDATQRGLYSQVLRASENAQRSTAFLLEAQPGMREGRHFEVIAFSFACAGVFVSDVAASPVASSTMGPNGGGMSLAARTPDGAYDVRVTHGDLLPGGVSPPDFPLDAALEAVLRRYERARAAGK